MDLNHRKQLGTLGTLWNLTTPFLSKFKLLILSVDSLKELAELEGLQVQVSAIESDDCWTTILSHLYQKFKGPRMACCFKTRDEKGLQRRWSIVCDANGINSTLSTPGMYFLLPNNTLVDHVPKDECGGFKVY